MRNALLTGKHEQLKIMLELNSNFSKPQIRRLVQQCKNNKKKIKEGTLDTKDADKRLIDALQGGSDAAEGKPNPKNKAETFVEFIRSIFKLF